MWGWLGRTKYVVKDNMVKRFWVRERGKKVGRAIGKKVRVDQKRVGG